MPKKPTGQKPAVSKKSKGANHAIDRQLVANIITAILQPSSVPSEEIMSGLARASGLSYDQVLGIAKLMIERQGEDPDIYFIPPGPVIG